MKQSLKFSVNGRPLELNVEPRQTLADCLRVELGLTGTHLGCEHGVCGACTVMVDGDAVRSCLMFAVQLEGAQVVTIEGVSPPPASLPCSRKCANITRCNAASARRGWWSRCTICSWGMQRRTKRKSAKRSPATYAAAPGISQSLRRRSPCRAKMAGPDVRTYCRRPLTRRPPTITARLSEPLATRSS